MCECLCVYVSVYMCECLCVSVSVYMCECLCMSQCVGVCLSVRGCVYICSGKKQCLSETVNFHISNFLKIQFLTELPL